VIARTIRGAIGFDGLLLSDDLGMKALSGGWAR
jgi:beta-glucosidase-like glycosyl hydrolase